MKSDARDVGTGPPEAAPTREIRGRLDLSRGTLASAGGAVPRSSPDGSVSVLVDGEIFGGSDRARRALEAWEAGGPAELARLRGFFALVLADARSRRAALVSDATGTRPLYLARRGDQLAFASRLEGLAEELRERPPLDEDAVVDFLVYGLVLGVRTFRRGVTLLEPATVLVLEADGASSLRTFEPSYGERDEAAGMSDWVTRFEGRYLETLAEMNPEPGPFPLPLSGGLDSRAIAAGLLSLGKRVEAYTLGGENSRDLDLAVETSRRLGIPHKAIRLSPEALTEAVPAGVHASEGMLPGFDTHILHVSRRIPAGALPVQDGVSSLDGYYTFLDLLRARIFPHRLGRIGTLHRLFTAPLLDARGRLARAELFPRARRAAVAARVEAGIGEVFASVPGNVSDPFDRLHWLDMMQRVRRYTMSGARILRRRHEVRHPFFHPRLLDLIFTMPPRFRAREKPVLGRVVDRLAPALADLPYERTGLPGGASRARLLLRYGAKALRRIAGFRDPPAVAVDYARWLRDDAGLRAFVRDTLLGPDARATDWFDPRALGELLDAAFDRPSSALPLVSRFLAFELWLRAGMA